VLQSQERPSMVGRGMSGTDSTISLARESTKVDFREIDLASVVFQTTEAPAFNSLVDKQPDAAVESRWL